jgi:hypothetical protein
LPVTKSPIANSQALQFNATDWKAEFTARPTPAALRHGLWCDRVTGTELQRLSSDWPGAALLLLLPGGTT